MSSCRATNAKAKLRDVEIDRYLKECVDLQPEVISEEYARMSADYAYWNEKYAEANRAFLLAEFGEQRAYASAYLVRKAELAAAGTKATEAMVDAEVKSSESYGAAVAARIEAQASREHLRGVLEALRTKREMLVSAGAHLRQEMQGDPMVRDRESLRRVERDGFD